MKVAFYKARKLQISLFIGVSMFTTKNVKF